MPVHPGLQTIIVADEEDQDALQQLLELFSHASGHELTLAGPEGESYRLTDSLQYVLRTVVESLAQNKRIAFRTLPASVPVELASNILNGSSEYVRTLILDEQLSAAESTGVLLIPLRELLTYKDRRDADSMRHYPS